jgi:hypothetical protein
MNIEIDLQRLLIIELIMKRKKTDRFVKMKILDQYVNVYLCDLYILFYF